MPADNVVKLDQRFSASQTEEGRYRLLVEAITDYAIYILDPKGIVSSWNAGAERFKGYTSNEIIGQHFARFYPEEERRKGTPQRGLDTASTQGKFEGEGWRIRKDGTRFWAHVVIDPIRAPDGTLVGYAKITRDLTERQKAEDILRQSEQQFKLLVQGVTDYAIYMLSPEGHVASWNAGAERIKGYAPAQIIGQHFSRFYSADDQKAGRPQRALEMAAREGRFESEGWRLCKDGSKFWASVVIDPIRGSDGVILGFAKITRDITERKQAERELEQAREALFQSQKMDAVGQLTGGVAHDFNNLLSAVLGSLELLRKRLPDDPKMLRLLDNAVNGAQRGALLTQRMLAFARRQDLNRVAVDVATLVRDMTDLLQSSLGPSISIETRLQPGLDPVLADQNQLELAILNLSVNARDAMLKGGHLVIEAREEAREGLMPNRSKRGVCISIKDAGEGMDELTLSRAMEPFFTTKGVGKGTGLGLSMVHGMAQQLGGNLLLKSKKGEGTTAELWIPISTAGAEAPESASFSMAAAQQKRVVLAVDDDALVLLNLAEMLEDLGHEAVEATSGKAALELLHARADIDLVITDQAMPGMTGLELSRAAKSLRAGIPIIIATGYADLPAEPGLTFTKLAKPYLQRDLINAMDAVKKNDL
jgi:PAS domain S-box-containing protein